MPELSKALVIMSVAGSAVSLLLSLLTPLTSKYFSATWQYYSKFIVVLLLVLPLSLFFRSYDVVWHYTVQTQTERTAEAEVSLLSEKVIHLPALPQISGFEPGIHRGQQGYNWIDIPALWLLGALATATLKLSLYLRFRHSVMSQNKAITSGVALSLLDLYKEQMGIRAVIRLAHNGAIGTPMLMGLVRPIIIIPDRHMDEEELRLVLRHELTHFRRKDLWLKALALIANIIHWFNPLSFMLVRDVNCLCEMSCDEAVVANMDFSTRKRYAETILMTLSWGKSTQPLGLYFAQSGNGYRIKRRLSNVLYFKKTAQSRIFLSVALAVMICAAGVVLATTDLSQAADLGEVTPAPVVGTSAVATPAQTSVRFIWPTPGNDRIVANFGALIHPITRVTVMHSGIDIDASSGDIIVAVAGGVVTRAEFVKGYGLTVVIDHGEGLTTLYAHCSKLLVKVGDKVEAGETIARIGSTGLATAPHLQFEVHQDGEPKDPMDYVGP